MCREGNMSFKCAGNLERYSVQHHDLTVVQANAHALLRASSRLFRAAEGGGGGGCTNSLSPPHSVHCGVHFVQYYARMDASAWSLDQRTSDAG